MIGKGASLLVGGAVMVLLLPGLLAAGIEAAWPTPPFGTVEIQGRQYSYAELTLGPIPQGATEGTGQSAAIGGYGFALKLVSCTIPGVGSSCELSLGVHFAMRIWNLVCPIQSYVGTNRGRAFLVDDGQVGVEWQGGSAIRLLVQIR